MTGFKVGFAWKGSKDHKNDRNRSTSLKQWLPLLTIPGIDWYCLQQEISEPERLILAKIPSVHLVERLTDWADTAHVLTQLDALCAVDTALIHLGGALGLTTCAMIAATPDFRWMLGPKADTPWYANTRLFRQPTHGDWDTPFRELGGRLRAVIHDHEARAA